jgi:hypothetical protein
VIGQPVLKLDDTVVRSDVTPTTQYDEIIEIVSVLQFEVFGGPERPNGNDMVDM